MPRDYPEIPKTDEERHLQVDVLTVAEKDRIIFREGSIIYFNLTFSAAGSQTIYTPPTGKKVQIIGFFMENMNDVEVIMRFKVSGNVIAALPIKGVCAMNLIGLKEHEGSVNEAVEVYASGVTTTKGWICIKVV